MIPSGSLISMSLGCVSGYATQRVLELDSDKQPCYYDETGIYNQETCLAQCKRHYAAKYCGCNPSFLFPTSTITYLARIGENGTAMTTADDVINVNVSLCFSQPLPRLHHRGFHVPDQSQRWANSSRAPRLLITIYLGIVRFYEREKEGEREREREREKRV